MDPCILALSTAVPSHMFSQKEIADKMVKVLSLDEQKAKNLKDLYHNSAIRTRYSVIPDFKSEKREEWHFWGKEYPQTIPGMSQRNDLYKKEAPKLAYEAADQALKMWGGDPSEITHIISVSCTGVVAPGIEFTLIPSLKLKWSVNRLGINFMGCFGAFKGLSVASAFAKEHPQHRVLLICTELCSLHLHSDQTIDHILANALFSDGAAAVIIGTRPRHQEKPLWTIHKQSSLGVDNTLDKMAWEAGDHGFFMKLSPFVPALLGRHIKSFTQNLLDSHLSSTECDWAIHPGGKSIIQAIEKAMKLEESQTSASWDVLTNYGNMSSATLLFVLDTLYRQANAKKWIAALGFGPGLSFEGLLLQKWEQGMFE